MAAIKKSRSDVIFDVCNIVFMLIMLFIFVYPLYFTVIASFSDPYAVAKGKVSFWVVDFSLEAYTNVFKNSKIWLGYRNTIFYTLGGTCWNLFLTIPAAYVLSKKTLPGRSVLTWYFLITMYFGGGLVPTYLIVKDLGLINTPITLVILGGLSVYNMIVTRVFFQTSIPDELYESARIDGASEFRTFFQIALPLSSAIIAVMALFYGVGHWNNYFTALIYINDAQLQPLQLVLRTILIQSQQALSSLDLETADAEAIAEAARQAYLAEAMKYSLIFIASAPLLIAYPFVQKYFVKGVMIGSLKG